MTSEASKVRAPGATKALVQGIIGIFVLGPLLGVFAIRNALDAKKILKTEPGRYAGGGIASLGLALGVFDLLGWFLGLALKLSA